MLNQFYSYLSDKIIEFFISNPLTAGSKYNIQFETEDQVRCLFEKLKDNRMYKVYKYRDGNGEVKYESYQLAFDNGIDLIISATIDNVQPDFLTRLRNMVGQENGYENKSILFIHNTTLDSIMGGTESFSKEGMPFHIKSIQNDIKIQLEKNNFTKVDKAIIKMDLDRKMDFSFQDSTLIFEYKEILDIVNKGYIRDEEYKNFGIFYDSKLSEQDGERTLKKKIQENANYFSKVDEIHNYGNPETQLEKYFDQKGIDKLKRSDWKNVDFKEVYKSVEEKRKIKPLYYEGCNIDWDKEEGSSKAKSRVRNIIVFNNERKENVELEFTFDDYLKKSNLKAIGEIEASTSGKKIKAIIKDIEGKSNFYKIDYKDDKGTKFQFKIVMVTCDIKYLESIKSKYSIVVKKNQSYISIKTNETDIVFNDFSQKSSIYKLDSNNDVIEIPIDETVTVKIGDDFQYENDSELILFKLKIQDELIPIGVIGTSEKISPIEGFKVWKQKRENKYDFNLVGDNKLQHGTKEYFARDEFRKNLNLEKEIIKSYGVYLVETIDGIEKIDIELDEKTKIAYYDILDYYSKENKLPSLTYLNDDLILLYEKFISNYVDALNAIKEGSYLNIKEKNLFKIGIIKREVEDKEILFTPLHPLNIAYQLQLNNSLKNDSMIDEVIRKFTSTYLLPYVIDEDDKLFIPMEQQHSPEWKYYVDEKLPRYKSSRDFVSKLVMEKIEEFIGHFNYLFDMGSSAPIRINLINTGDSKEILQGIFKYYVKQLRESKIEDILPIDIFIYSDTNITNAFEEVAFSDNISNIKDLYNLDLVVDNMSEEDVLNLYREKVNFYSKSSNNGIEYSHITFIEMKNDVKCVTSKMSDIPSGVILNGEISGVPSVFLGDSYRTGFGIKYSNKDTTLMNIAIKLNALTSAISGEPFNSEQCKAISVPNKNKDSLDNIYNSSHWVTFIDPKVDLNFFKNDPDAKDLLIIHYSDQYTTAGGYDAITVTRKSAPYQRVIEEFLNEKGVEKSDEYSPAIINMFNAINGDWLLKLLSSKSHFPKEKISILSAIKLALAEFDKDNFIWVPISLEEVLRVSGGAGLKQKDGFLSVKNLGYDKNGVTSDDILLVGLETIENNVFVHCYPIEVKIGANDHSYIQKGINQAKSTKKIFKEILCPNEEGKITNTQKVYRNFLMQLVITSAEKLNLYNVCEECNWNTVIDSDLRRKLLNEEYTISQSTEKLIGEAAVISFKKGISFNDIRLEDNVRIIEMSEEDGINFITKSVREIRESINSVDICEIDDSEDSDDSDEVDIQQGTVITEEKGYSQSPEVSEQPMVAENKSNYTNLDRNMQILFGINQKNNKEIYWCPNDTNKLMHTNTGIIGTMGTGKTQFTKSMITQIYREGKYNIDGKKVGILIFDYKGDYNKSKQDFIDSTNAKVFELYHLPFNPLAVIKSVNSKPMLPLHTANSLKETLAKAFGLGIKQETLLRDLIMEAYEKRGIVKNKPDTWDNPAPTLKDVYDIYVNRDDLKEDSLYAAFSNLIDFEIFEPDPFETKGLFDLIDGVTVIDLSGYDPGIQNLVVAITLDLFYSQMQAYGHSKIDGQLRQLNKIVLVDEADNFLSKDFASLKKILKEGREFGVGTVLSTQLLSHFSTGENEYANYILSWVIHRVDDLSNKDVKRIFNTQSKSDEDVLFNKIKSLNKHYSLVKMGDSDRPIFMKDKAFWELDK